MAPPCYADLGKSARDLLNKGYNFGSWKVEAKSSTDSGVKFKTNGNHNTESGKVLGEFESEFAWKEYGLKMVEKWNTDNTLSTEVSVEDQLVEGSKVTFCTSFNPTSGKKKATVKSNYKAENINVNADVDLDYNGPILRGAAVAGYKGWLGGYQMAFDTSKSRLANNNFTLAYDGGDYALTSFCNDMGQDVGGSFWHKLDSKIEYGAQLGWNASTNAPAFSVGTKYALTSDTTLRAKVNCQTQVGVSLQQKLRDGMSLTLSSLIDAKNFNAGGHRLGLALDFEQ